MIATPDDVAQALDMGVPTPAEKARIEMALAATLEAVQAYTGRSWALITDATEATSRTYQAGCGVVLIDDVEQADTTVAESYDLASWTTLASNEWHLRPFDGDTGNQLRRTLNHFAPWVRVTGRHGVFEIPTAVKQATVLKAAALFQRNPQGVTFGGEFGPIRISKFEDPDVARLLDTVSRPALSIA